MAEYLWFKLNTGTTNPIAVYEYRGKGRIRAKGTVWNCAGDISESLKWQAGIGDLVFAGFHTFKAAKLLVVDEIERRLDAAYQKKYKRSRPKEFIR